MNINEIKEKFARMSVQCEEFSSSLVIPCPFSPHENIARDMRPNFMLNKNTLDGLCTACGRKATIEELIAEWDTKSKAAVQKSVDQHKNPIHVWSTSEILNHDFGDQTWLVENLISKPGIVALSGNPGDFKTWLCIHIAAMIARGEPVFGKFAAEKGAVLIIDEEDHLRQIKSRLASLSISSDDSIYYVSQAGIKIDEPATVEKIVREAKERNVTLVMLDSLVRVHSKDENSATQIAIVFQSLQGFIRAGISVLFTHHHRKELGFGPRNPAQSLRGSSDILAAVDGHFTVEKTRGEDVLIIQQPKNRHGESLTPFELTILKGEHGPIGFAYAGEHQEKTKKAEEAAGAIIGILGDQKIRSTPELKEILKEEKFGKGAVDAGIKIACERGLVEEVPKEELPDEPTKSRRKFYRLTSKSQLPDDDKVGSWEEEGNIPVSPPLI